MLYEHTYIDNVLLLHTTTLSAVKVSIKTMLYKHTLNDSVRLLHTTTLEWKILLTLDVTLSLYLLFGI